MNMMRAKTEIKEAIHEQMHKYRTVSEWQDAARRDVCGDPSQYELRKEQLSKLVDRLKQAEEALSEAIEIDEMETATNDDGQRTGISG